MEGVGLQLYTATGVESERDIYTGLVCEHDGVREDVIAGYEESFAILDEARALLRCRSLPGVVHLAGACIVTEPVRRVTGLLLEYCPGGDLEDLLE